MGAHGLNARQKTHFQCTPANTPSDPVVAKVLNQDVSCDRPELEWGTDMSYL